MIFIVVAVFNLRYVHYETLPLLDFETLHVLMIVISQTMNKLRIVNRQLIH